PMPNSEVKRRSADGSVGSPHARVGNCQASDKAKGHPEGWPFCAGKNFSCRHIYKPSPRIYGKLATFLHQESSYEPLLKTLEHLWH
ncbi:hypothetical protein K6716_17210, partial [Escherichia marmotae]|uniref:hypothetical protein n=1 Tax=Escherichia coli TaxID=562 RepID=UPI001C9B3F9A